MVGVFGSCVPLNFLIYHSSNYDSVNKTLSSCDHLSSICIILLSAHYGTVYFYNPANVVGKVVQIDNSSL